jgi:2,3,4,5-tetrahydropyridine-2-carboxylate N-succinyltransferase
MVDTWATVGSCAQIGPRRAPVGRWGSAGVLEPLQANPTDHRGRLLHRRAVGGGGGVVVGEGAVLSMGRFLSASTKIVDRETGEVHRGRVPPYSVVVPGLAARRPA